MTFSISESSSRAPPRFAAVARQAMVKKLSQSSASVGESTTSDKPLHSYGVNSLLAIELREWIARELAAEMAIFDFGAGDGGGSGGDVCESKSVGEED